MRLRTLTLIAAILTVIGGLVWSYGTGGGATTAMGAGGLPLIKADTNPAKMPPEEGGENEIIPNADSTVFAAMGTEDAKDPSMENVAPPEEEPKTNTEFAGFRTGFALPKEAPRKTESLFGETDIQEPVIEPAAKEKEKGESKYFSGIAPEVTDEEKAPPAEELKEPGPTPEPVAKKEEPKPEPAEEEVQATAEEEPMPLAAAAPIPEDNISAQALEAEEKILVMPAAKPPIPKTEPVSVKAEPKPEPKAEVKKEEPKKEDAPFNPVAMAEKAADAESKKADDVYPIKPRAEVTPTPAPVAASGSYFIQLSSAPKGSDMQGTWRQLQGRYGQALAGLAPSFPEAEIAGKGTFVRIQAGPMSKEEANKRCSALRAVNPSGGCLVIRR